MGNESQCGNRAMQRVGNMGDSVVVSCSEKGYKSQCGSGMQRDAHPHIGRMGDSVAVAGSGMGNESQCGTHIMQKDGK
jgi:hypothetical protein